MSASMNDESLIGMITLIWQWRLGRLQRTTNNRRVSWISTGWANMMWCQRMKIWSWIKSIVKDFIFQAANLYSEYLKTVTTNCLSHKFSAKMKIASAVIESRVTCKSSNKGCELIVFNAIVFTFMCISPVSVCVSYVCEWMCLCLCMCVSALHFVRAAVETT